MTASGTGTRGASVDWRRLVPHTGAMLLLSDVLRHDAEETACGVEIAAQRLFREADGSVPAWIGLEYMAQCIAVHAALSRASEEPPPIGFLVSVRGLRFHCRHFEPAQRLEAVARRIGSGSGGLSSFACSLRDAATGASLAEGRIGCYVPPTGAQRGSS
jgi:predicted hotdog family 3-hydroxylacyl-ACP dehydratase